MQRRSQLLICLFASLSLLVMSNPIFAQDDEDEGLAWLVDYLPSAADAPSVPKLLRLGDVPVQAGELLIQETFEVAEDWETFTDDDNFVRVVDGRYEIRQAASDLLLWGQRDGIAENIAISADVELLSDDVNIGYGLMCRVAEDQRNQDGYYFFISGDSHYTIFSIVANEFKSLVEWTPSEMIVGGEGATNQLLVVCAGDQLSFYANGEHLVTTQDDALTAGAVSAGAIVYDDEGAVHAAFDNIDIYEVVTAQSDEDNFADEDTNLELELGDITVSGGELIYEESFLDNAVWRDTYTDPDGSFFSVEDEQLRARIISGQGFLYWSLSPDEYDDTVVMINTNLLESDSGSEYGIICRAEPDNSGRGYYMLISTVGEYALLVADDEEFVDVIMPTPSAAINAMGENELIAVCAENRIALFANGELLFEYSDNKFTSGAIGLIAVGYGDAGDVLDVTFDDLRIFEAMLEE